MSKYLVFATVSFALLLSSMSGTSVAVAFPKITSFFSVSLILAGWIISIYQLVLTVAMPVVGKVSEVLGRKFTFILCLALFTLGSLLCAIAPNIELLIFFRFIQALGGGGFMPSAAGIVADEFPQSRQRAIGLFSSIFPIGMIIGPNLGGWLVSSFGWRSVFWINIPLGVIIAIASTLLLRSGERKEGKIDFVGACFLGGSLSALMSGLSVIGNAQTKQTWAVVGALFGTAIGFMIFFVRHEGGTKDPILDMEVLRGKPFIAANIYNLFYGAGVIGIMSLIPTYAVSVYQVSTFESGLILTPRSVGMIASSLTFSIFILRWGYRWPMIGGTSLAAISLLLLGFEPNEVTIFGIELSNMVLLFIIMALSGLGLGVAAPAANNACIELMPQQVATITGIRGMFRQTGGAVSITIATLVLHQVGNMAQGFHFILIGLAIVLLATIPAIFAMPSSPNSNV